MLMRHVKLMTSPQRSNDMVEVLEVITVLVATYVYQAYIETTSCIYYEAAFLHIVFTSLQKLKFKTFGWHRVLAVWRHVLLSGTKNRVSIWSFVTGFSAPRPATIYTELLMYTSTHLTLRRRTSGYPVPWQCSKRSLNGHEKCGKVVRD